MIFEEHIVQSITSGGVGVLPTDTVYGLVASAKNQTAVARLYALKSRECKPGTIVAADKNQLLELGLDADQVNLVSSYWPGPVSIILPAGGDLSYLHQGMYSLACRVVADVDLGKLLDKTGPLLTSSANLPGEVPAQNIDEARRYFGDNIDFYVDGGDYSGRQASRILAVKGGEVVVIRA
jgi:L-threonylcarbamoyladenylate synthase